MELIVPQHAAAEAVERDVTFEEIERTIQEGVRFRGHSGRIGAALVVPLGRSWGRKRRMYDQKRIVVYFVESAASATVVTVISQYGRWEA